MEEEDRIVKEQLIDTIKNIKQKYHSLQDEKNNLNELMNVQYKPFLSPLNKIAEHVTNKKINAKESEKVEIERSIMNQNAVVPLKKIKYINLDDFLSVMDTDECDSTYGITKSRRGKYKMGQTEVRIDTHNIVVSGQSFRLTAGLMSLLFLKSPNFYTHSDLLNYKKI